MQSTELHFFLNLVFPNFTLHVSHHFECPDMKISIFLTKMKRSILISFGFVDAILIAIVENTIGFVFGAKKITSNIRETSNKAKKLPPLWPTLV